VFQASRAGQAQRRQNPPETHHTASERKLKLFVAGPSKNLGYCSNVIQALHNLGHEAYDWTEPMRVSEGFTPSREFLEKHAIRDLSHVADADGLIWIDSPSGTHSEGASVEVGFALGRGIPVVSFAEVDNNKHRFYRHLVPEANSIKDAVEIIKDLMVLQGASQ
jgi:hypothetical protein